ncbi:ABC transporter permease [Microbulbifer sp. CAU 1566]|uniref:ABC transporter permease n=1 Tax=Microbulbifer sp. CAU 1566 TaxID=2933269 RepID=UPI002003A354|nr:ABC transporter permease [Microbulbifer sp. CAU 1566]MCK7596688.1 ABC transporter permease [Microbulbifer sp. CAU 1566]
MGLGRVFLSHYQRHPGQLIGLLLILVCAAILWSGVRSLTGSAEDAVVRSRAALEPLLSIERVDQRKLTVEDFAQLRRAGLCVSPRMEVRFTASDTPVVVGIDPFSAACLRQYAETSGQRGDAAIQLVERMIATFERPRFFGSTKDFARWQQLGLPNTDDLSLEVIDGLPVGQLVTDISVAAELAVNGHGRLAILLPAAELQRMALPAEYRAQVQDYGVEPDPLVDAFLLSLNALGALTLLVAALLVRSVYRLASEQRRGTLDILIRLGVPSTRLRLALITEILLVALIGGSLGLWLGGRLAAAMRDGFRGTLSGLFDVETLAQHSPTAGTWLGLVLILAIVVAWACADLWGRPALRVGQARQREVAENWRWWGAIAIGCVSLACLLLTGKLWLIFLATLGCLVSAGLLLPELLSGLFRCLLGRAERHYRRHLLEWSISEMRALCRLLQLPLTALAFAIAAAIGVQAMVTGFESTFARWLDQRLQGDLYLDPGRPVDVSVFSERLRRLPGVNSVLPMVRGRGVLGALPVDVLGVDPSSPLLQDWPFLDAIANQWAALPNGGVMINEQLARRQALGIGDQVTLRLGSETLNRKVLGIYADYGRPEGELLLPIAALPIGLPNRYTTFVLGSQEPGNTRWQQWPDKYPWLTGSRLRDQQGLKQAANTAFARTFQMTRLLNTLTLTLAGTALALMGLAIFRLRQGSYTLLYVYGVQRTSLRRRLIAHSMLVTGLLGLLAIPLGIFLGWVLVARVNPAAFGWALPLHFYPGFWLQVWVLCLSIGAVVGALVGNPVRLESLKSE